METIISSRKILTLPLPGLGKPAGAGGNLSPLKLGPFGVGLKTQQRELGDMVQSLRCLPQHPHTKHSEKGGQDGETGGSLGLLANQSSKFQ